MNKKDILLKELETVSDDILDEVIDFVQFLKHKKSGLLSDRKKIPLKSYNGVAKGFWASDAQEIVSEMINND